MDKPTHKPIRLYWGENYAPMPRVIYRALQQAAVQAIQQVHLYPGGIQGDIQALLSTTYAVPKEFIMVGNGIEGLLLTIFHAFVQPGDEIVTLDPTFGAYAHNAHAVGAQIVSLPVGLSTQLHSYEIGEKITPQTKMICIASPNTSTGIYHIDIDEFEKIVSQFSGLVLADECYFGLGKQTVLPLLSKYRNLIVLRSASKSLGLAGIRMGFGFAHPSIIQVITKQSIAIAPDPLPTFSYFALKAVLPYRKRIATATQEFIQAFRKRLAALPGIYTYSTKTTFIPVQLTRIPIGVFIERMSKHGILLKDTSQMGYLLVGVPPKQHWKYVIDCFQKELTLVL